jgi:hypothetical protein
MCDETSVPKSKKFVTLADMEAEQEKIALQFAYEIKRLKDAGASLREIGEMKKMNHERVRQFLKLVEGRRTLPRA